VQHLSQIYQLTTVQSTLMMIFSCFPKGILSGDYLTDLYQQRQPESTPSQSFNTLDRHTHIQHQ